VWYIGRRYVSSFLEVVMSVSIELPIVYDVLVGFNSADPDDAADLQRLITRRHRRQQGLPVALLEHVAKTKAGRTFVKPLVSVMTAGSLYSAQQLANLLGAGWTPRRIASKLCVLGRPEKRHRAQIFERHQNDMYSISAEMKAAISTL
jgi:hypothetical protein